MIQQMIRPVQGALRQEKKFEVIANHLANVDTTGFKGDVLSFDSVFHAAQNVDMRPGPLKETGNPLDVALAGDGFFRIETSQGVRYTRNGNFVLNQEGRLVTQNGDTVLGDAGPIIIQGNQVEVSEDGQVQVDGALVDRLSVVAFESPWALRKIGNTMFAYQEEAGEEKVPETLSVKQNTLEGSNVVSAIEMTRMIETHRMYEAYQKMMLTFDEVDSKVILEVGRAQ